VTFAKLWALMSAAHIFFFVLEWGANYYHYIELLIFKARSKLPNKSFTKMLSIFKYMLLEDNEFLESMNLANKVISPLEPEVQNIHATNNNCTVYHGY
jgi:hypothetical protein